MITCAANATFPLRRQFISGGIRRRRSLPYFSSFFGRTRSSRLRPFSSKTTTPRRDDGEELKEFTDYMDALKNYERVGVPTGAGTDSDDGFDLGRMRRLLRRLGDPHLGFKAVHIAGTKGKGSTAAFLSSMLREEGYFVGCYTSPHLLTIRECISFGRHGEPVPAIELTNIFHRVKDVLDQSIKLENGALTYFEIFTALAFSLFFQEKVDIAIVEAGLGGARDATNVLTGTTLAAAVITTIGEEHLAALGGSLESIAIAKAGIIKQGCPLVIGGPFENHIEALLRKKASSMNSPVISASDPSIRSFVKTRGIQNNTYPQICDIHIDLGKNLPSSIELSDVNLRMVGDHQLQNAVTATCTALCLRNQGWKLSDVSIRVGLEKTLLPGRSQFLTNEEIQAFGLSGVSVFVDGAHTEASAKSLAHTIKTISGYEAVALVVAMASDKDHAAFSRELLSGIDLDVILLTEVSIAKSRSRMTSAFALKDTWVHVARDLGVDVLDIGEITHTRTLDCIVSPIDNQKPILVGCSTGSILNTMKCANQLLKHYSVESGNGLIVVTGSLHIVSSVLACI